MHQVGEPSLFLKEEWKDELAGHCEFGDIGGRLSPPHTGPAFCDVKVRSPHEYEVRQRGTS